MENIIGLKELRQNVAKYARKVQAGESFTVFKHSKPLFKITPIDDDQRWEAAIDFTKFQPGGIDLEDILQRL